MDRTQARGRLDGGRGHGDGRLVHQRLDRLGGRRLCDIEDWNDRAETTHEGVRGVMDGAGALARERTARSPDHHGGAP